MTMRPPADTRGGLNHLVDTQIGRAFPVVHKVYQHLDAIEYIAQVYEAGRSRDIVLRTNHTKEWIEWQYKGEPTWTILFKFSDLLGSDIADVVAAEQAIANQLELLKIQIEVVGSDTLTARDQAQTAQLAAEVAQNAAQLSQQVAETSASNAVVTLASVEAAATTATDLLTTVTTQQDIVNTGVAQAQVIFTDIEIAKATAVAAATEATSSKEIVLAAVTTNATENAALKLEMQGLVATAAESKDAAEAHKVSAEASASSAETHKVSAETAANSANVANADVQAKAQDVATKHSEVLANTATVIDAATQVSLDKDLVVAKAAQIALDAAAAGTSAEAAAVSAEESRVNAEATSTDATAVSVDKAAVEVIRQNVLAAETSVTNLHIEVSSLKSAVDMAASATQAAKADTEQLSAAAQVSAEAANAFAGISTQASNTAVAASEDALRFRNEAQDIRDTLSDAEAIAAQIQADRITVEGAVNTVDAAKVIAQDSATSATASATLAEQAATSTQLNADVVTQKIDTVTPRLDVVDAVVVEVTSLRDETLVYKNAAQDSTTNAQIVLDARVVVEGLADTIATQHTEIGGFSATASAAAITATTARDEAVGAKSATDANVLLVDAAKTSAEAAALAAEGSKDAAALSESNAKASEDLASASANNASDSASTATTKAGEAAASASQASAEKDLAQQAVTDAVAQVGLATAQAVRAKEAADSIAADKIKLDGIAEGANNYIHPANHAASIITQDANNRFVTDAEKVVWSAKQTLLVSGTNIKTINGESLLGVGDLVVTGSGGGGPTLQGDTTPYATQTKTYQITNYNSFSTYAVSASAGTASILGDTITFTAPSSGGNVSLTLTVDGQPTVFAINVQAGGVATPTNTSPANGAVNVTERPTLTASGYSSPAGNAFASAKFQISTSSTFTSILHDSGDVAAMTYAMPAGVLAANTTYYVRARVKDVAGLVSDWSAVSSFTTKTAFAYVNTPTVTTPTNGQTEIPEQPTLQTGAFAATGSADTHAASQWQIRTAAGAWAAPLHDSGESAAAKTSYTVPAGILLAGQTQYVMRVRHKGTSLGWSEWSSDVAFTTKQQFAQIIGIVCTATGGGAGTWQRVDENFNAITTTAATFSNHPTYAGVIAQTIDGQAMVKVPKFYVKAGTVPSGTHVGKRYWMVSDQPAAGFALHPAFMNAGAPIDQFWVGKYQGTNDGGTKLGSVAGATPLVSIDFPTMQARAAARNTGGVTGFGMWDYYKLTAAQTLALIEMGGADSQALIGQGNVSSSRALTVDNATVAQATWRGIVGLWGNVFQMVDGLRTNASNQYEIWDNQGNKTWVNTGITAPASGYPVTFASESGSGFDLNTLLLPATSNATAGNGTTGDYLYSVANCVAYHGGSWSDGANAGLFCLYVITSASSANTVIGGRLAKV